MVGDDTANLPTARVLAIGLIGVFVAGLAAGAMFSGPNFPFLSSSKDDPFIASVDTLEGTNLFILVEVDEGDNDEEVLVEHILYEFFFTANDRGGLITWDFGDGTTATGPVVNHSFVQPGVYTVRSMETLDGITQTQTLEVTVHLDSEAEVDNMECVCAPTAKDTVIVLSDYAGTSTLEGFVRVEHDGSSESCSLRNPLQECHLRVLLQRLTGGDVVEESVLFDATFRTNEQVVDFVFENTTLEPGQRWQLRLETDQLRDWHKPTAAWSTTAPVK